MKKHRKIIASLIMCTLFLFVTGCGSDIDVKEDISDDAGITSKIEEDASDTDSSTSADADKEDEKAVASDTDSSDDKASKSDTDKADNTDKASPDDADVDDNVETASSGNAAKGNGIIVVLDPGHSSVVRGGTEPIGPGSGEMKAADSSGTSGCVSGLTEYQLNFQIATKLRDELTSRGYTVLLTREDNDTGISCSERAAVANNAGADAFIRIHADGSDSSSSSGAMGICITSSNPYISSMYSESRILSDDILNAYCAATGFSSRGVWETDTMTGNNWSQVPTTLLEMGFMTNPNEDSLMADSDFQTKMVTGIANGVDAYFFRD